ncbi:MAG: type II toxin-antitoxin system VapC family toxin [Pseudomonadota bacterium]
MEKIVLDSCVFVKLFLDEADYQKARNFMRKLCEQNVTLLVPPVFVYEVYYIAQKYGVDLDFIEQLIARHQDYNMQEIALNPEIIQQTKKIIQQTSHPKSGFPSFYDASYHALAMLNDCHFITADRKHYEKTKELGHIRILSEVI